MRAEHIARKDSKADEEVEHMEATESDLSPGGSASRPELCDKIPVTK